MSDSITSILAWLRARRGWIILTKEQADLYSRESEKLEASGWTEHRVSNGTVAVRLTGAGSKELMRRLHHTDDGARRRSSSR